MTDWKRELLEWGKAAVIGVVLIIVIRMTLITNYTVSGHSMEPTLHDGDRVLVSKISYTLGEVDRYDLIVFHGDEDEDYVKRVIGLPGDEIEMQNDILYINGKAVPEPYLEYHEDAQNPYVNYTTDFKLSDVAGSSIVPNDCYFVLGDNRPLSLDGRMFGFIKEEDVVGQVSATFWPMKHAEFHLNP